MLGRLQIGMGAYPDQLWFDPNRPSWLPYWLDTPTESAKKYATVANVITVGNPTGNTTPSGQPGASQLTVDNTEAMCITSSGTWDSDLEVCNANNLSQYIILGVLGLIGVLVVPKLLGH